MPQSSAVLAIIIVNWNTRDLLAECLTSLYATVKTAPLQVWVVDNASTDDSVPYLRAHFPQVSVIENTRNVGFATANNQALVRCEGSYALLLNSDTQPLPGAIDRLVQLLETLPRAGAAAPMLVNADGSFQAGPNDDLTLFSETLLAFGLARYLRQGHYPGYAAAAPQGSYAWVGGTCLLLRRAAWEQVGGLDPSFFMYSEEADWCFRARAAGWTMLYDPAAKIIHLGGGSSRRAAPAMRAHLYKSKLLYFRKHRSRLTTGCLRAIFLFTSACKAAGYTLLARLNRAKAATYSERASSFRLVFDEIMSMSAPSAGVQSSGQVTLG